MGKVSARLITAVKIGRIARGILRKTQKFDAFRGEVDSGDIGVEPILLSLSMELALKAWFVFDYDDAEAPRTHNLVKLFDALLQKSQETLDAEFRANIAPFYPSFVIDYGLRNMLYQHQDAFVDWRYRYEGQKHISFEQAVFVATLEMVLAEFEKRYFEVPAAAPFPL